MGTSDSPATFTEMITDMEARNRETGGVTATQTNIKRFLNIALKDMHLLNGEMFPWAHREAEIVTNQNYTDGTVTITQGSTSLTGASTLWNTANGFSVNNARTTGKLRLGSTPDIYKISAIGSDTAITLGSAYTGSDLSGASYSYFEDEYALPSDYLRPVSARRFDSPNKIGIHTKDDFYKLYPRNSNTGKPLTATIIDRPPSGDAVRRQFVVFHPAPDTFYTIPYWYVTTNLAVSSGGTAQEGLSADDDEPIVPRTYRHAIVSHALWHWYRDRQDDSRAEAAHAEYNDLVIRILNDTSPATNRPEIRIRKPRLRYRTRGSRRFTTGTRFDELREPY